MFTLFWVHVWKLHLQNLVPSFEYWVCFIVAFVLICIVVLQLLFSQSEEDQRMKEEFDLLVERVHDKEAGTLINFSVYLFLMSTINAFAKYFVLVFTCSCLITNNFFLAGVQTLALQSLVSQIKVLWFCICLSPHFLSHPCLIFIFYL